MSETTKMILLAAVVVVAMKRSSSTGGSLATAGDFERPQWGANWISNQWATIMQGTMAHTGQLQPGWHF